MNDLPEELDVEVLPRVIRDGWGIDVATIEYAPVGFGSYHWIATDQGDARRFVTVDDLDRKPWFGDSRDVAFDGMARSFGTALALRERGLDFVLAPMPALDAEAVRRIDDRYSIAVFPLVDGESSDFGEHETPEQRAAMIAVLARLHSATSGVATIVPRPSLDLPGRPQLEDGLRALDQPWTAGPYSERAGAALAAHASDLIRLLGIVDRLATDVAARASDRVVTHGEPHAANVIWTGEGPLLIDWDTVALAPRERDLWMVVTGSGEEAAAYAALTGYQPDPRTIDFYRLTWDVANIAAYVDVLRSPDVDTDDMLKSYENLRKDLALGSRWAQSLD